MDLEPRWNLYRILKMGPTCQNQKVNIPQFPFFLLFRDGFKPELPFRSKERQYQNQTFSVRIDVIMLPTFSMSSLLVCLPVENRITLLWISGMILNKKYNLAT